MTAVLILAAWALLIFVVVKIFGGIQEMNEKEDKASAEFLRDQRRSERAHKRHHPTEHTLNP